MASPGRKGHNPASAQHGHIPRAAGRQGGERRGKEKKGKAGPDRTWQPLTVDQLLHLVVPGPQVGLSVGALGRNGLAADSAGGRRVQLPGLPVPTVRGGFVPAALAGHSHGEEPGGRATAPP